MHTRDSFATHSLSIVEKGSEMFSSASAFLKTALHCSSFLLDSDFQAFASHSPRRAIQEYKDISQGGEIAQLLKALAAKPEDPGLQMVEGEN